VHIVNADMLAKEHGLVISESTDNTSGAFTTLISCTLQTDKGELTASGTTFGNEFLRLVRLNEFQMETYLDGLMLLYWHRDVPGLIGAIGTTMGKHKVNISHMALGREKQVPGGLSVAILNLDNAPSAEAMAEAAGHPEVTGVDLVKLPPAGASLPWLGL
jgi:D-3-phosphoglycerate dehydrogenase